MPLRDTLATAATHHTRPVLVLALLVLLALTAAYAVRPSVTIDVGDYYDSAFLENFHAREVDAAGTGAAWEWPPDQEALVIPGQRSGDWIATIEANEALPGEPLRGAGLSVNGVAVALPGKGERFFTAFIPPELASDEELVLRLKPLLSGGAQPEQGVAGRVVLQPARTYRWSRGCEDAQCRQPPTVMLPGLGRGTWRIALDVIAAHPDNSPLHTRIAANGTTLATLPDSGNLRRASLLLPADVVAGGNLELTIHADAYADPRPLGVFLAGIAIEPGAGSPWAMLPPWSVLGYSLVIVIGVYASLAVMLGGAWSYARGAAFLAALALLLLGAWALATHRFPTSFMLPPLALLLLWSVLLLLVLRPLLVLAFRALDIDVAPDSRFLAALLLIFFIGYWLKAGGMLYPYFIGIDIHWHMERVRWILDGQLPLLYGTDSPLNESTMPEAEWGPQRPVIPYSPYFHMFAALFAIFPWSLELSANMLSALVDCSHIFVIALLARKCDASERATVLAALLYAILPVNVLLHSWGNLPTTFGLWWAFVLTAFIATGWLKLHRPIPFAVLVLLLLAALLFYTVAAIFVGLFLVLFTLVLTFFFMTLPASQKPPEARRSLARHVQTLWLAVGAAVLLSLLIYYGQYIRPVVVQTIPYIAEALTSTHEETGRVGDTLPAYLARHTRLTGYGLVVPLLLTAVYLGWEWRQRAAKRWQHPALLWAAVAAWYAVMLLFVPLAYKISMVDKHFFVTIPLLMIASGIVFDRLWARGWPLRAATLLYYTYLAVSALNLWFTRIATVQQG